MILERSPGAPRSSKSSEGSRVGQTTGQQNDDDRPANQFSSLIVEEPVENPLGSEPQEVRTTSKVHFKLEEIEGDATFAVWCFLEDMSGLRQEVRTLWSDYKAGNLSFSATAEMTANATMMAHSADYAFVTQYKDLVTYQQILDHLGLTLQAIGPNVWLSSSHSGGESGIHRGGIRGEAVVELLCPRTAFIFQHAVEALAVNLGTVPPASSDTQPSYLTIEPFGVALLELIPFIKDSTLEDLHGLQRDVFLRVLRLLAKDRGLKTHMWMVTACQFYMDIHNIMGSEFISGLTECKARLTADLASVKAFLGASSLASGATSHPEIKKECKQTIKDLRTVVKDPPHCNHSGYSSDILESKLYNALPIIPGMIINSSALSLHVLGIRVSNYLCVVLSAAHLYKAALQSGAVRSRWEDMDFVIETQAKLRAFVLDSDIASSSKAKRFAVALGQKIASFAKGRSAPLPKPDYVQRNARQLLDLPYMLGTMSFKSSTDSVIGKGGIAKLDMAIGNLKRLENISDKDSELGEVYQQYSSNGKMTLAHLFRAMKRIFIVDELDLKFDYVSFYVVCDQMIQQVATACAPVLRANQGRYPFKATFPHEIVHAMLCIAEDRKAPVASSKEHILQLAGQVMEKLISSTGNHFLQLAKTQTSGHLISAPKHNAESASKVAQKEPTLDDDLMHISKHVGELPATAETRFLSKEMSDAQMALYEAKSNISSLTGLQRYLELSQQFALQAESEMTAEQFKDMSERFERITGGFYE